MDNQHRETMRALEALIERTGGNGDVVALADAGTGQLATKLDLEALCADMRTEISGIRINLCYGDKHGHYLPY